MTTSAKKILLGTVGLLIVFFISASPALARSEFEAQVKWGGAGEHQIIHLGGATGECRKITIEGISPKTLIALKPN